MRAPHVDRKPAAEPPAQARAEPAARAAQPGGAKAPRPSLERAARLGMNPAKVAAATARTETVQRRVGFEVELSVPTVGPPPASLDPRFLASQKETAPALVVEQFLTQSFASGTKLGSLPEIELLSDHFGLETRAKALKLSLITAKRLSADVGGRKMSNLEYSSAPVDELEPGANGKLGRQIAGVAEHAKQLYSSADQEMVPVPGAPNVHSGVPVKAFKDWLGGDYEKIRGDLLGVQAAISNKLYLQVTAGIIPSAIPDLFALGTNDIFRPTLEVLFSAVTSGIEALWRHPPFSNHPYFTQLPPLGREALKGVLTIAYSYMIGDALLHTSWIEDTTTRKNAVLFLSKMNLGNLKRAAAVLGVGDEGCQPPDGFIQIVNDFLVATPYVQTSYWLGLKGSQLQAKPERAGESFVADATTLLLWRVLHGQDVTVADPKNLLGDAPRNEVAEASGKQLAVPLEFRRIHKRPTPDELSPLLLSIVEQVRRLNTKHLKPEEREALINASKGG